jgi:hypothetical protein
MKKRLFAALLCSLLASAPAAQAIPAPYSDYSGHQWLQMTDNEKMHCILASIILLDGFRVPMTQSPQDYMGLIDRILAENPQLMREDILNIFASTVFRYEPPARQPLAEMLMTLRAAETSA